MYQISKLFFTAIFYSTFIFSSHANAKDCFEQSPYLTDSENSYYNLEDSVKLSNQERNTLATFLKRLKGKWTGTSVSIECRGPDRAPERLMKSATIKVKSGLSSTTELKVTAEKDLKERRIKRTESLTLPNLANTYDLSFTNRGALIFSEKYRRSNALNVEPEKPEASSNTVTIVDRSDNPNATPAPAKPTKRLSSRLVETIYEIKHQNNTLLILRLFYANGVYVGEEKWSMQAK